LPLQLVQEFSVVS